MFSLHIWIHFQQISGGHLGFSLPHRLVVKEKRLRQVFNSNVLIIPYVNVPHSWQDQIFQPFDSCSIASKKSHLGFPKSPLAASPPETNLSVVFIYLHKIISKNYWS